MKNWDAYLTRCAEQREVVDSMVKASHDRYGDYAYAAGYLQTLVNDLLIDLAPGQRDKVLKQLKKTAEEHQQATLLKVIKASA